MTISQPIARAPAARLKLEQATSNLAELEAEVAALALDASEGKRDAEKVLVAHRSRIEVAARAVSELRRAVALAEKLDRQASAVATANMRAEQLAECKKQFAACEKAMGLVLKAAAEMAAAYGDYSEATLRTLSAVPAGTVVPVMGLGPNGAYGAAFGPAERLILAEIYRLSPERSDGIGRFVLPFAKPTSEMLRHQPDQIPAGIDELRAAHAAIIADLGEQIEKLNEQAARAAEMTPADRKSAA